MAYLVDIFERSWERARPFTNRGSAAQRDIAHEQRADDDPDAHRGARRPGQRQAAGGQPAHVRRLRRGPQGGVRGRDPLPARLHDGSAGHLRQRATTDAADDDDRRATTEAKNNEGSASGAALVHETGRGGGLEEPGHGGSAGFPSQACGVVGTSARPCRGVRPAGPTGCCGGSPGSPSRCRQRCAGELTPASPIVIAAVATRIAALRRKVIKCLPWCGVPGWCHPPNRSVCRRGGIAVSPQLAHLIALQNLATPERRAEPVLSALRR